LEQNPEAVRPWLEQDYRRLRAQAAQEGAVIYWGDETAVKEDAYWVREYAPRGQTPVLAVPARWTTLSMISAISPRGEVAFQQSPRQMPQKIASHLRHPAARYAMSDIQGPG
jgi:hypothetical protein